MEWTVSVLGDSQTLVRKENICLINFFCYGLKVYLNVPYFKFSSTVDIVTDYIERS